MAHAHNIGTTPQYFLDNHLLEVTNFVTRTMHRPDKHPDAVIRKTEPWEKVLYPRTASYAVAWDDRERLYKAWYEDVAWDFETFMGRTTTTHGLEAPGFHETCDNRLLYAESEDGVTWRKPCLGYRQIDGRDSGVCLGSEQDGKVHAGAPILDPLEQDATKR